MVMPMAILSSEQQQTRQRLIEAAGAVFAEHGFRAATVRDICRRAGANVAAVNYHFGGKEGLYDHVLRFAHRQLAPSRDVSESAKLQCPQTRLKLMIKGFFRELLEQNHVGWHTQVVAREMIEPTAALDRLVEQEIRPRSAIFEGVIRQILGPKATPAEVGLCVFSIISQCVFYLHSRPVIERLRPNLSYSPQEVAKVAEHVARFSLAALENWSGGKQGGRARPGGRP